MDNTKVTGNTLAYTSFVNSNETELKRYIVCISNNGLRITDCSITDYKPVLDDEYYAGFVVYATNQYQAIFQAGIKHNQLQNS